MLRGVATPHLRHHLVMLAFLASILVGLSAVDLTPQPIRRSLHTQRSVQDGAPAEPNSLAPTRIWWGGGNVIDVELPLAEVATH